MAQLSRAQGATPQHAKTEQGQTQGLSVASTGSTGRYRVLHRVRRPRLCSGSVGRLTKNYSVFKMGKGRFRTTTESFSAT